VNIIVSPQFVILKDPETRHFAPISPPRLRYYIRSTSVFCSNPPRTAENPGNELLRRLQRLGSRRGVVVRFEREPGKGGHGTLCFGDRLTALQDRRAEILHTMSRQLGRPSGICGRRAIGNCERLRISGADRAEALSEAPDCLSKALAGRTQPRRRHPIAQSLTPRSVLGRPGFEDRAEVDAVQRAACPQDVSRRPRPELGIDEERDARLIAPRAAGSIADLDAAVSALGYAIAVELREKPAA
jgi:hypothetical protein